MIMNRIYETQNLLSLQLVSFLVGLRTYQHLSQPALAWLKVRYYAEVLVCSRTFDVEKYLSLSFPNMAICWLLVGFRIVEGGEGNWPRFPSDFSGHALGL
jgi:hypothetical protein